MFHTQGVIFKKAPYREFDEIFTIYTRDFGKIEAIGRGIKKPAAKLANHLQVFDFSDIEFVLGKNFKVLTGASVNKNLLVGGAAEFFDLLDSLTPEDDPDENIWNLVLRFIEFYAPSRGVALENPDPSPTIFKGNTPPALNVAAEYFQFQLLSLCGFSPNILSFNAKLPSTEKFLKLFAKSDEKAITGLKISQEELSDMENAMDYFKDTAFGYLR